MILSWVLGAMAVAASARDTDQRLEPTIELAAANTITNGQQDDVTPDRRITYPAGHYPVLALPNGERRRIKSLLNVPRMRFGDYVWDDHGVASGPAWVRIDLSNQLLSVFRNGYEIGTTVIIYGTDGKPTPTGIFPIMGKAKEHQSTLYDAPMPFMLRLTGDGVAIHASNVRHGSATHGCIGVPSAFAEKLFAEVRRGTIVAIIRS
jgi:hypothetical protein